MALPLPAQRLPRSSARKWPGACRCRAAGRSLPPHRDAGDFIVFDNGRPQPLRHFAHTEEPLDLILLFDISGSMKPGVAKVAEGARRPRRTPPGDRVAVFASNLLLRLLPYHRPRTRPRRSGTPRARRPLCRRHTPPPRHPRGRAQLRYAASEPARAPSSSSPITGAWPGARSNGRQRPLAARPRRHWTGSKVCPADPRAFPIGVTRERPPIHHEQKYGASMDPLAKPPAMKCSIPATPIATSGTFSPAPKPLQLLLPHARNQARRTAHHPCRNHPRRPQTARPRQTQARTGYRAHSAAHQQAATVIRNLLRSANTGSDTVRMPRFGGLFPFSLLTPSGRSRTRRDGRIRVMAASCHP